MEKPDTLSLTVLIRKRNTKTLEKARRGQEAQRIRVLDAPSKDKLDSSSDSEQDKDNNDDKHVLIIQEMAKKLPCRAH